MVKNLLQKIKRTRIPNTYYALISVAFFAVIGVMYMWTIGVHNRQPEDETPVAQEQLSPAAQYVTTRMELDMSRKEVIRALGIPTWAVAPEDEHRLGPPDDGVFGLELHWSNPICRDVVVLFSPEPYEVIGWDDGADFCSIKQTKDTSELSCTLEDRRKYCR